MIMDITYLISLFIIFSTVSCQKIPSDAIASIMREILSPTKTEQAFRSPEGHTNDKINPGIQKRRAILETGHPRIFVRKEVMPDEIILENPNDIVMTRNTAIQTTAPTKMIFQKPNRMLMQSEAVPINTAMKTQNDFLMPSKIVVKNPELKSSKIYVQNTPETASNTRKILVQKANEIPMLNNLLSGSPVLTEVPINTVLVKKEDAASQIKTIYDLNMIPKLRLHQLRTMEPLSYEKVADKNTFLPAASPISAFSAAFSNTMPQSRGQFLKKIPLPPPTI